jgi:hypothetical protein
MDLMLRVAITDFGLARAIDDLRSTQSERLQRRLV